MWWWVGVEGKDRKEEMVVIINYKEIKLSGLEGGSLWQGTLVIIDIIFEKSLIFYVKLLLKCLR